MMIGLAGGELRWRAHLAFARGDVEHPLIRGLRILLACLATTATGSVLAQATLPPEWFAPPETASELGITRFSQSPFLDGRGLPPVEERLPDDPVVIQPYRAIGKYGGTARITLWDSWQFFSGEHALTISADMRHVLPNLAESLSPSEDGRITTIRLRPGIRWSDGAPLTADDFMFRMNHVWLDREMNPVTRRLVGARSSSRSTTSRSSTCSRSRTRCSPASLPTTAPSSLFGNEDTVVRVCRRSRRGLRTRHSRAKGRLAAAANRLSAGGGQTGADTASDGGAEGAVQGEIRG